MRRKFNYFVLNRPAGVQSVTSFKPMPECLHIRTAQFEQLCKVSFIIFVIARSHALSTKVEDGSDYQMQRLPSCGLFLSSLLTQLHRYWIRTLLMQHLASRELVTACFFVRLEFLLRSLPVIHSRRYESIFLATICDSIYQQMLVVCCATYSAEYTGNVKLDL